MSTDVSYQPMPSPAMAAWRTVSSAGAIRLWGQMTAVCRTMPGTPFSSSTDTSAWPTPSSVMTSSALKAGLGRREAAAARTAFCSLGV